MKLARHKFRINPATQPGRGRRWLGLRAVRYGLGAGLGLSFVAAAMLGAHAAGENAAGAISAKAAPQAPLTTTSVATAAGRDAFVSQYCLACHNAKSKVAGLVLEGQTSDHPGKNS